MRFGRAVANLHRGSKRPALPSLGVRNAVMSSPGKKLDPTAGRDEEARIKAAAAAKANPPTGAMA